MASRPLSVFRPDDLSNAQIAGCALELLGKFVSARKITLAPPIPVEDILEKHLRLTLETKDMESFLGEPGILGAAWIDLQLVRVEQSLLDRSPGRYYFTLAHEIGHWQLHRPKIVVDREMPTLFDRKAEEQPPTFICRSTTVTPLEKLTERQADRFAANLLMPAPMMREAFSRLYPNGLRPPAELCREGLKDQRKAWLLDPAREMVEKGGFSNCSREAMRNRIDDLKLVDFSATGSLF